MNERKSGGIVVRAERRSAGSAALRWIFASATLTALMIAAAAPSWAQSQNAAAKSATASTRTAGSAPATAKPVASATGGNHEAIRTSGRWVIEVRNPDGKVVTHREFENSIQSSGMLAIEAMLTGGLTPGGLAVALNLPLSEVTAQNIDQFTFSNAEASPCDAVRPCIIAAAVTATGSVSPLVDLCQAFGSSGATDCAFNLTVAAPGLNGGKTLTGASQIVLSGTITAQVNGTVNDVETLMVGCVPSVTAQGCLAPVGTVGTQNFNPDSGIFIFTQRQMDGANGDPAGPISVLAGQTVAVSVTLTFQ